MPTRKRGQSRKYRADIVRAAFRPWAVGTESEDGEQRMFCPLCEEPGESNSPSASIKPAEGVWNCLKTHEHGGSVHDLAQILKRTDPRFSLRARPATVTVRQEGGQRPKIAEPQQPLENQDKPTAWHDQLGMHFPEQVDWATNVRGVRWETLRRAHVGYNGSHWTFPGRLSTKWLQVKFIGYPGSGGKKIIQTPGARAMVWPATFLKAAPNLPVLLVEGEWDALLAEQESDGLYVAVTGTGGAGTPPVDLSMLADREVFVAYDCDESGHNGAEKVAARLREVGARVHVIDLTDLGLPFTMNHGADISDYFRKYGGTAEKLAAEFDRLRDDDPAEHDEVYAAIEALFNAEDEHRTTLVTEARSDDDILQMRPARYVIDGWLPVGFFSDFYGEPGSKKTFVLLDMLRHIRAGMDWHGNPVTQGAALLFEGEGLEQLQTRILAWNEHHDYPELAPGASFDTSVNITTAGGVAAVARTVRDYERKHNTSVVVVAFDPLVEFMTGDEVGDGTELATRGLRALARYLDIAVVVGAHTNASGERARGSDHLRMRSGAHVRVEALSNGVDLVGLVQEKQKNGERRALQLLPVSAGSSLALSEYRRMSAAEYYADKSGAEREAKRSIKALEFTEKAEARSSLARDLVLETVRDRPGLAQRALLAVLAGQGAGSTALLEARDALVAEGVIVTRSGSRGAALHYLADGAPDADEVAK